ncbi:MAG: cysteine desulfurase [Clostridia bacterium]|nr:cysteine desulfurase [Clostridia bacterium]
MIYLDHAATTRPSAEAVTAVNQALCLHWGNPSSLYDFGMQAENVLEDARRRAACLLGCDRREIYFTSGGTEANVLAVLGAAAAGKRRGKRIVTSAIEHASVKDSIDQLEKEGFEVVRLRPGADGNFDPAEIGNAVTADTVLVSLMLINNETGICLPVRAAADAIRRTGAPALLHCDAVQAFGKIPISVKALGVDLLTASSHKIHGPKGCGLLYKSAEARIVPRTFGGAQERGLRPGTEPVPAVAGFGAAMANLDIAGSMAAVKSLNDWLRAAVKKAGYILHSPENASDYILNFSVPGYRSETLLHALESAGIYVSSGSACAKGQKSHVLQAMGLPDREIGSALRVSLAPENTIEELEQLMQELHRCTQNLKASEVK